MSAITTPNGRTIRKAFQSALTKFHRGDTVFTKFFNDDPDYQQVCVNNIKIAKDMTHNIVLCSMYDYGQALAANQETPNDKSRFHTASIFIYEYFVGEPEAINFIQGVSSNAIAILSKRDQAILIQEKLGLFSLGFLTEEQVWGNTIKGELQEFIDLTEEPDSNVTETQVLSTLFDSPPPSGTIPSLLDDQFDHRFPPTTTVTRRKRRRVQDRSPTPYERRSDQYHD
jgi:hypothetical protein